MVEIIVAIIGGAVAIFIARLSQKVSNVHAEVRTNHGKKAYEYLEMMAPLVEKVESVDTNQSTLTEKLESVDANQNALLVLMAQHTVQDDLNFKELREEIARLRGDKAA